MTTEPMIGELADKLDAIYQASGDPRLSAIIPQIHELLFDQKGRQFTITANYGFGWRSIRLFAGDISVGDLGDGERLLVTIPEPQSV